MSPARRTCALLAGWSLGVAALAGCGAGEPPTIDPAGVDHLVVPLTLPIEPGGFRPDPDGNRWLPLTDAPAGPQVAGVATREWVHDGVVDLLAEDDAGNLWWFGREGVWGAGQAGARPGLVMPARPRRGDGFRRALVPGLVDEVATVEAVGDGLVVLDVSSDLHPSADRREVYREGLGLVSPGAA